MQNGEYSAWLSLDKQQKQFMELCIHNKNLFRISLSNDDLMKNENLNNMFDVSEVAFNNHDNLQSLK